VKKKYGEETALRSVRLDVVVSNEKYRETIDSIRLYRMLCRKAFSVCLMSEIAGAQLIFRETAPALQPTKAARDILATAFCKDGAAHFYQLREWILNEESVAGGGSWRSFVWDSLRLDVSSLWRSRDPSIPLTRGYLALQGERGVARFRNRGIGFPAQQRPTLSGHSLTFEWDREIGPVTFSIRKQKLDGGRYFVWKALRDELPGFRLGTAYLSEKNGLPFVVLTYKREIEKQPDHPTDRVAFVKFGKEKKSFIVITGPEKSGRKDFSAEEACGVLEQIRIRRMKTEARREACGNPRWGGWGTGKGYQANQKIISRNTAHRIRFVTERNHLFTRAIIDSALKWNCGKIELTSLPADWFGEPWRWNQFEEFYGIVLIFNKAE
jgi:hypothetical protein